MIANIELTSFLSFGPEADDVDLRPLNLLIGPNGSGKSNFVEAFALLASMPFASQLPAAIRQGGGIGEWFFKNDRDRTPTITTVLPKTTSDQPGPLCHVVALTEIRHRSAVGNEAIQYLGEGPEARRIYRFDEGSKSRRASLYSADGDEQRIDSQDLKLQDSILSQFRDPTRFPELARIARLYEGIHLYRDWTFGPGSPIRQAQPTDLPSDRLLEDGSNLALVLNRLREDSEAVEGIREGLRNLNESFVDFHVRLLGGSTLLMLKEEHGHTAAARMSDGTLRYLMLLALLCDPAPPPILVIEEPELGLHPDLLPSVARLLKSAAERTQLIVTTHSEILVSCFTETPEDIVVCEQYDGETYLERLDGGKLADWLKDHRLGELWLRGDLGGTRW